VWAGSANRGLRVVCGTPVGRASQCHMYAERDKRNAGRYLSCPQLSTACLPWVWHRNVAQRCECSTCAASPLYTYQFLSRHASAKRSIAAGYKQVRTARLRALPCLPLTRMPASPSTDCATLRLPPPGLHCQGLCFHTLQAATLAQSCSMYVPCLIAQACPGCSLLWLSCGHIMDSSGLTDHATMPLTD
jgi:hypothetical protein